MKITPRDRDDNRDILCILRDIASIKETLEDTASEVREEIALIKENIEEISYEAREEREHINHMLTELLAEIQHID